MKLSQDVEKTIFPLKIVWLALLGSILIYALVLFQVRDAGFTDEKEIESMKTMLSLMATCIFIFTIFCSKNKEWLIKKFGSNSEAPYLKSMSEEDQKYLSHFGGYFISHIIIWALNECGAILGFVLSFISGNFTYYMILASIAFFINLFLFKPDYKSFRKGKNFV